MSSCGLASVAALATRAATLDALLELDHELAARTPAEYDLARQRRFHAEFDALLTEISDTWASRLAETGRALRISADAGLPPSPASTAAVRQILAVLTDNAARHGVGAVTVHAREASGTTAIDVSDEGTELRQDEAALFRRRTTSGHGIGLPLARDLAEAEGARLRLSSRTPTTFTLFLPTPTQPPTGN